MQKPDLYVNAEVILDAAIVGQARPDPNPPRTEAGLAHLIADPAALACRTTVIAEIDRLAETAADTDALRAAAVTYLTEVLAEGRETIRKSLHAHPFAGLRIGGVDAGPDFFERQSEITRHVRGMTQRAGQLQLCRRVSRS